MIVTLAWSGNFWPQSPPATFDEGKRVENYIEINWIVLSVKHAIIIHGTYFLVRTKFYAKQLVRDKATAYTALRVSDPYLSLSNDIEENFIKCGWVPLPIIFSF